VGSNPTGGTYSIYKQRWCCYVLVRGLCLMLGRQVASSLGDGGQVVGGQGGGDGDVVAVFVQVDREAGGLEQGAQQRLWRVGEVEPQVWHRVQQRHIVGVRSAGLDRVRGVQVSDKGERGAAFTRLRVGLPGLCCPGEQCSNHGGLFVP
jgi:hypothetical protein